MHARESRPVYERRMHKVLDHIDHKLDQSLDLAKLAEVARTFHRSTFTEKRPATVQHRFARIGVNP